MSLLRSGRLTTVWRAWDEARERHVVIKMPAAPSLSAGSDDPVIHESAVLAGLRHPGVVPLLDAGVHDDIPYLVMPYLGGGTLEHRRPRREDGLAAPGDVGELWHWLPAVAAALDVVHERGYLHGDVKPPNVLYDGTGTPMLADFGSARLRVGGDDAAEDRRALALAVWQWLMGDGEAGAAIDSMSARSDVGCAAALALRRPDVSDLVVGAVARGASADPAAGFASCAAFAAAVLAATHRPTSSDRVQLVCPQCDRLVTVNPSTVGQRGRCPRCRAGIIVAADLQSLELPSYRMAGGRRPVAGWRGGRRVVPAMGRWALLAAVVLAILTLARRDARRDVDDRPPDADADRAEPVRPAAETGRLETAAVPAESAAPSPPTNDPAEAARGATPAVVPDGSGPGHDQDPPPVAERPRPAAEPAPEEPARLPVPGDEAIARALADLRLSLAADYRRAAELGSGIRLGEALLQLADRSADACRRYAALLEIERLCLEDGRLKDAIDAVNVRCEIYADDALAGSRAVLVKARQGPHVASPGMCRQAVMVAERFLDEERFALAEEALAFATQAAGTVAVDGPGSSPLVVADLTRAIEERRTHHADYVAALNVVAADPTNAAASGTIGTYLCLTRRDWIGGLPYLAASNLEVADIARRHLRATAEDPPDPRTLAVIARDWWRVADGEIDGSWGAARRDVVRRFAASLYASVADALDDPVERRIAMERASHASD